MQRSKLLAFLGLGVLGTFVLLGIAALMFTRAGVSGDAFSQSLLTPASPAISVDSSIVKHGSHYSFTPSTITLHFRGDFTVKNTTNQAQPVLVGGHYAGTVPAHGTNTFGTLGSRQGIQTFIYHLGNHPTAQLKVIVDYAVHVVKKAGVYHFVPNAVTIQNGELLSIANDTGQTQALLVGGHYLGSVTAHHVGQISLPNPGTFQVHLGAHPGTLLKVTVTP